MKRILIIWEGAADRPLADLGDRTPLEVSVCPEASRLATLGAAGRIGPVKQGWEWRNEMYLARYLGISREETRGLFRGPVEAAGLGLSLPVGTWVYRVNFATFDGDILSDCRTPGLREEETRMLLKDLAPLWKEAGWDLVLLEGGAALAVDRQGRTDLPAGDPPGLREGEAIDRLLPGLSGRDTLHDLLERSRAVLEAHPANDVRVDLGENPANALLPWGGGPMPDPVRTTLPEPGVMVSRSPLARGLAVLTGMEQLDVADPWKELEADRPVFRIPRLVELLRQSDILMLYVQAPREPGRYGTEGADKVRALERLDQSVLAPMLSVLSAYRPWRLLMTTDSLVSSETGRPEPGYVPMVVSGEDVEPDAVSHWDERMCASGSIGDVRADEVRQLLRRTM